MKIVFVNFSRCQKAAGPIFMFPSQKKLLLRQFLQLPEQQPRFVENFQLGIYLFHDMDFFSPLHYNKKDI